MNRQWPVGHRTDFTDLHCHSLGSKSKIAKKKEKKKEKLLTNTAKRLSAAACKRGAADGAT